VGGGGGSVDWACFPQMPSDWVQGALLALAEGLMYAKDEFKKIFSCNMILQICDFN